MTYELTTQYDSRASFYGKARVEVNDTKDVLRLISYTTHVATVLIDPQHLISSTGKQARVYGTYSATTLRHIKEFLRQNGFVADNSKQIMADYGTEVTAKTHQADYA